ncbi:MAG: DEAD/DEAH box helicase [Rickettsiales bacterium]
MTIDSFKAFDLPPALNEALEYLRFEKPTPIQAEAIPHVLAGRDILGSAQTGTGKTGAFGIPLIAKLLRNPHGSALIMTPTRELAVQVIDMIDLMLGLDSGIKGALLIGGESMGKQFNQLRQNPRIIVGTPGRINDHLAKRTLKLDNTNYLVLDETDRMLDMGFSAQIDRIVAHLPRNRQTLLFSATLPDNIVKLSARYLKDPVRISMGATNVPIAKITQENITVTDDDKYSQLLVQLQNRTGTVIVFVKTKHGADRLAKKLRAMKHEAGAIHGDLRQNQRDIAINDFRNKKTRILVATDIAARGLDIPHIEHVINYDLPQAPEDYIHRIGRTARAGAEGAAVNLISPKDSVKWKAIQKLLNPGQTQIDRQQPRVNAEGAEKKRPKRKRSRSRQRHRGETSGHGGNRPPVHAAAA